MEAFKTITGEAEAEQVIEKSRFIALVKYIEIAAEAEKNIKEIREILPNARHYVYAYRIHEGRIEKASDDGEPQGTGGRPVMELLQHRQLWNVQIIVVRYFGGILLGTGGLTRAYGGTARLALENTAIVQLVPHQIYVLRIPYSWFEQVRHGLKQKGTESGNEQFSEEIDLEVYIRDGDQDTFIGWLGEFTNGQVSWKNAGTVLKPVSV
ncbi:MULTISPECIES: YigZ family protein [unclassified Dehalobacter]|uniref:YigZ family protein n=1 Tax=unclassified Dehalobacter TaxID=2635733 RepID=UPI000E6C6480|nr:MULTISPECIES: YigZ family protein [unclassified Dehalobacter]RJE48318.1 YigZ family protein [Dehalobacter sp. MCB1]TCX50385.1 YigZ family protein [Dehalobacter sp. 14DCB1]TCX52375.1 YigZ family protein [Dehalobacter sp. 12DCB1]